MNQRQEEEVESVRKDIEELLIKWQARDANGLVVCSVMLMQFVAMSGHLFNRTEDYDRFVKETVELGRKRFESELSVGPYMH